MGRGCVPLFTEDSSSRCQLFDLGSVHRNTEARQTEPEQRRRENRSESNFMKGFSRESSVRAKMNTNAIIRHRLFGSIQPIPGPGMGCAEGGNLKLQRLNFPIHIV